MSDYLVTDTELTSIANAIRSKTGDTEPIEYPSGFTSAINGIVVPTVTQDENNVLTIS